MVSKQILYFATTQDLAEGFGRVEKEIDLEYCLSASQDTPEFPKYGSYKEIPNFGISLDGKHDSLPNYLVYEKGNKVIPREVPQRRGGIKYFLGAANLPDFALCIKLSGVYKNQCLIYGVLYGTNEKLYKLFRKDFLKCYETIKSYRVGPEAVELFGKGIPLTTNVNADPKMHLKR